MQYAQNYDIIFVHCTIDKLIKMCDNIGTVRTAETLNTNSVNRIQVERLVFMNIEQLKIYLLALVCNYNLWANRAENKTTAVAEENFSWARFELLGAVITAKLLGVDVKIAYTEPTYYYSTIALVSVQ